MPAGRLTRRAWVQRGAARLLRDRGCIQRWVPGATNAYNYDGVPTYADGGAIPLSYQPGGSQEATATVLEVATSDATVYLPLATVLTSRDRIAVTHRNGVRLGVPIICDLVGEPIRDITTISVTVKTVIEHD